MLNSVQTPGVDKVAMFISGEGGMEFQKRSAARIALSYMGRVILYWRYAPRTEVARGIYPSGEFSKVSGESALVVFPGWFMVLSLLLEG